MNRKNQDIEDIIREIEHIRINLNDPLLGPVFWEEAMKNLIAKKGSLLIDLLRELERKRE